MNKKIDEMSLDELADAVIRGEVKVKQCAYCGGEFYAKNANKRYCSERCRQMWLHQQKDLRCEVCGKPIPFGKRTYCSDKCRIKAAAMSKRKPTGTCVQCGAPLPPGRRKFCSKKCELRYNFGAQKSVSTNKTLLSTGQDLVSMAKAAREHGMTYGKYLEMIEKQDEHPTFEFEHGV